ncbi:Unknown protein, partial [Striga hermonthica]
RNFHSCQIADSLVPNSNRAFARASRTLAILGHMSSVMLSMLIPYSVIKIESKPSIRLARSLAARAFHRVLVEPFETLAILPH